MQITLNQDEIFEALEGYVRQRIQIRPNQAVEIDLKASRGEHGYSATLDIVNKGEMQTAMDLTPPEPTKDASAKPAPKAEAKPKTTPKLSPVALEPAEEPAEKEEAAKPVEKASAPSKPATSPKSIFAKSS